MTDHLPEFTKRGMCARDPKRAFFDGGVGGEEGVVGCAERAPMMGRTADVLDRRHFDLDPADKQELVSVGSHREGLSPFDILQPAWAGLYSGAIHPTAEGHAIVADHMVKHVRALVDKPETMESAAR